MDRVELIRERLSGALDPEHLEIIDDSHRHAGHAGAAGGGGHFTVIIVSEKFAQQKSLMRHRLVYQAVTDLMPSQIHALSINAMTPEEYQVKAGA